MMDLPAVVYGPIAGALLTALGVVWKAWRESEAARTAERKADTDWKNNLLSEVLTKED